MEDELSNYAYIDEEFSGKESQEVKEAIEFLDKNKNLIKI